MTPIAHTSHWIVNVLYLVPVLVAIGLLGMQAVRNRRRRRESAPGEAPPAHDA